MNPEQRLAEILQSAKVQSIPLPALEPKPESSWLDPILKPIAEFFGKILSNLGKYLSSKNPGFKMPPIPWDWIYYLGLSILAILVLLLIWRLTRLYLINRERSSKWKLKQKSMGHEPSPDTVIDNAIRERHYALAARLLWRQMLILRNIPPSTTPKEYAMAFNEDYTIFYPLMFSGQNQRILFEEMRSKLKESRV
ncbi:MAG: hypothetical protein KDD48_00375 [Bdellovibrionales bacterium]|nr:hypothetical protein [Bdellovibrionales bacterium]